MSEWVSNDTYANHVEPGLPTVVETGGVYKVQPRLGWRLLTEGERLAVCPRCGQRFAATEENTPEANRDLHFLGDDAIPSICVRVQ
jgi:hypothetical protein